MEDRNCNKCLWATRNGGCASWDCEFISKSEAYKAWKEMNGEENEIRKSE